MASPSPTRLYQIWKGKNKFFCGGRIVFGPDAASVLLSTVLIGGPAIAFCIKVFDKVNGGNHHWYPVFLVAVIATILDVLFLYLTSSRDPGIVPRNSQPPETDEAFDVTTPSMEWVNGRTPHLKLPRTKDVIINGHNVKVKYCDTCLLYRPPRASHCSICNNCVQRFDHHCPWVGQCIGVRNYRLFFMFISTSTALCIFVFVSSLIDLVSRAKEEHRLWRAVSGDILSTFLIIYCFITVWFVGGLTIFHSYLICTNQTTYENFRYHYDKKENPFNRGIVNNLREVLFSKIPPSLNEFRALVREDEHVVEAPVSQDLGEDAVFPKEKIDIEMGVKIAEGSGFLLPEMLQHLDFDDLVDSAKSKEGDGRVAFDMSAVPTEQESAVILNIAGIGGGSNTEEKSGGENIS